MAEMLCIHGLDSDSRIWSQWQSHFERYTVHAPNLPGHSAAERSISIPFDFAAIANHLAHEYLKPEHGGSILVGHSMGAIIAVEIAAQYPDSVAGIILLAPAAIENFTDLDRFLIRTGLAQAGIHTSGRIQKNDNDGMAGCADDGKVIERYAAEIAKVRLLERLSGFNKPLWVGYGDSDLYVPNKLLHPFLSQKDLLLKAKAAFPNAATYILKGRGHFLPSDKPKILFKLIDRFLAEHSL